MKAPTIRKDFMDFMNSYSWNTHPYNWRAFGRQASFQSVRAFAEWWDGLPIEEARKAVDLIWPRNSKPKQ